MARGENPRRKTAFFNEAIPRGSRCSLPWNPYREIRINTAGLSSMQNGRGLLCLSWTALERPRIAPTIKGASLDQIYLRIKWAVMAIRASIKKGRCKYLHRPLKRSKLAYWQKG